MPGKSSTRKTQLVILMYKVQIKNPKTGKGFIEGYRTAKRARKVVQAINTQYLKDGKGLQARYLGNDIRQFAAA